MSLTVAFAVVSDMHRAVAIKLEQFLDQIF